MPSFSCDRRCKITLRSSSTAPRSSSSSVKLSSTSSSALMSSCSWDEDMVKISAVGWDNNFCGASWVQPLDPQLLLLCAYPREAGKLSAVQVQAGPFQCPLICREASQRATTILQKVRQLGLQPLNGRSCHGGERTAALWEVLRNSTATLLGTPLIRGSASSPPFTQQSLTKSHLAGNSSASCP